MKFRSTGWINSPLMSPGAVFWPMMVSAGTITDVDVRVNVRHNTVGELALRLEHGGQIVELVVNHGGTGSDFAGTVFDDEAEEVITDGSAPFFGSYAPVGLLSTYDGMDAGGIWKLAVVDTQAETPAELGVLIQWELMIRTQVAATAEDCNGDAIPDSCRLYLAGDYDQDGNVDLGDYAELPDCLAGPGLPLNGNCSNACLNAFDLDDDGDIDLADLAELLNNFLQ